MPFSSPVRPCADPVAFELLKIVLYKTFARVSDIELPALFDFIEYHKMILIPMEYTR